MTQIESNVLMDMSKQLGMIASDIKNIKEDVLDLKNKDVEADKRMTEVQNQLVSYLSSRQDSIRDSLQVQITANTNDIAGLKNDTAGLKNAKASKLVYWWDLIINKLIWAMIIAGAIVLLKWLHVPTEITKLIGG